MAGVAGDSVVLARQAQQHGQQALVAGDGETAMRWLDRAHRLAPQDGTITLALASACLRRDNARAEALFRAVAEAEDVRAAWLGLAAACFYLGDAAGAAGALADALARHVPEPALLSARDSLADAVARGAGAAGWCGVTGDGRIAVRPVVSGTAEIRLDGRRCAGPALPRTWMQAREISVCIGGRHLLGSPIMLRAIRQVAGFVEAHQGGLRGWAWHPGEPDTDPVLLIRGEGGRGSLRITAADMSASVQHGVPLARPRGFAIPADALAGLSRPLHVLGRDGADLLGSPLDPGWEQSSAAAAASALAHYLSHRRAPVPPFPPPAIPAEIAAPRLVAQRLVAQRLVAQRLATSRLATSRPAAARLVAPRPTLGAASRPRRADVVIPVYGDVVTVLACLDSVLATVPAPHGIIVVDDASPEPVLRRALAALAADGRIRLVRHARNRGFPASVNDGMAAARGRDVVLLNSDTLVPPGWMERLRDASYSATGIGTATPLSNHASILSYPGPQGSNPVPDRDSTLRLDTIARRANNGISVDIPVGVGFCMYVRRDCLDAVGPFRAEVFAQGYGEENDFCLRARHLGWRHVAVPGLFVGHLGGASFGQGGRSQAVRHLQVRNEALLNRLHPGYDRLIAAFGEADPLAEARRRFDLARWREGSRDNEAPTKAAQDKGARDTGARDTAAQDKAVQTKGARIKSARDKTESAILITHDDGGGVERQVGVAAAAHRADGLRAVVLRPVREADGPAMVAVDGGAAGFPNLRYTLPREMPALLRLLCSANPRLVEVHHTLHHPPAIYDLIARLGVPYDVHVHDYPWFCPQVSLVGVNRRYCGEPAVVRCEACVADAGRVIDEAIGVQALRDRSASFLGAARRVVVPSADAAARMRRHFPALRPTIVPLEDDGAVADPPRPQARSGLCRVCTLGAIGVHKGYDVLLACARDAAERRLPMEFVVVGHTIDDARLLATGRVFVTGRFAADEAVPLIRAQDASLALLPSVWPETWNFGLTELWRAGLSVAAFDFGAPAERIRRTGRGFLLPFGLPPRGINQALVAAVGLTGHEGA
jgi:GT2 family glycosyltransferase/glycosyltransferase involved in cell wall biosynthesis